MNRKDPPDEPVLLEATIEIRQIVPFDENLPQCRAVTLGGWQCNNYARWRQNDQPVCGMHIGRPSVLFLRKRRGS